MIFWISDNSHPPSKRSNHISLGDSLFSVIRSLSVDVWPRCQKQFCDCRFVEYSNHVNRLERRNNLSPVTFGQYRATVAFQAGYLVVRVNTNYEQVAQGASAFKIAHVPCVQEIEASVSQNNSPSLFLFGVYPSHEELTFKDKRSRINYFHAPGSHRLRLKKARSAALSSRVLRA